MRIIDIRSDTVTQPTQAMREAMYRAEVGDDVYGDDPTVAELEALAAQALGKERGLFVPSGTMGNQLAIMTHTRRGDEVIVSDEAHIFVHEVGAPAVLSSVSLCQLHFEKGVYDAGIIEKAIREDDIHEPPTSLICVENALSNGRVVPLAAMREVYALAQRRGLPVHLDGARVYNAAVALGVDVREIADCADTISCCLSKGLCAPVGTVLAGGAPFIERAKKNRKLLGGGMRQAGILAAAGILALRDMPAALAEDHANARYMAELLQEVEGVSLDAASVEINMVWFHVEAPEETLRALQGRMLRRGVKINGEMGGMFRFVTNHDVTREDVEYAVSAFAEALRE